MSKSKPFLILQLRPEDSTSDSEFDAILKYSGLEREHARRVRVEKCGIPSLDLDNYSAVIVGGSPFDISTPENEKQEIQKQIESDFKELFDQVVPRDFPFFGACSGIGLLGNYLGVAISGKFAEAVGGATVSITDEGKSDPLLAEFPEQFRVLLGHKEACDTLPDAASLLIQGDACPIQMFRIGNNVYATQFHPEGDGQGFAVRINAYRNHGYFKSEEADSIINAVSKEDTFHSKEILRRFVDRYS